METYIIKTSYGNEYKLKKINFVYRAAAGLLPNDLTRYVETMINTKTKKKSQDTTDINAFAIIGDIYKMLEDIMLEPQPNQDLFDKLTQKEIMEIFNMALAGVENVEQLKELENEKKI